MDLVKFNWSAQLPVQNFEFTKSSTRMSILFRTFYLHFAYFCLFIIWALNFYLRCNTFFVVTSLTMPTNTSSQMCLFSDEIFCSSIEFQFICRHLWKTWWRLVLCFKNNSAVQNTCNWIIHAILEHWIFSQFSFVLFSFSFLVCMETRLYVEYWG